MDNVCSEVFHLTQGDGRTHVPIGQGFYFSLYIHGVHLRSGPRPFSLSFRFLSLWFLHCVNGFIFIARSSILHIFHAGLYLSALCDWRLFFLMGFRSSLLVLGVVPSLLRLWFGLRCFLPCMFFLVLAIFAVRTSGFSGWVLSYD